MRTPVSAAGLLLIERQLMAVMGMPTAQVRAVLHLGLSPTDPVTPLLAVLGILAEALIGYLLVVLALGTLSLIPGSLGRLASRATCLVSPDVVRRALDLLAGGTLLVQATLTATPGVPPPGPVTEAIHATVTPLPASVRPLMIRTEPAMARPPSRRLAAPLPPWLGGGPSKPRHRDTVEPGDTLWEIAATHLAPSERSPANVHRYWQQLYRANRRAIGADPDLILPGTHLDVPPFGGDQR